MKNLFIYVLFLLFLNSCYSDATNINESSKRETLTPNITMTKISSSISPATSTPMADPLQFTGHLQTLFLSTSQIPDDGIVLDLSLVQTECNKPGDPIKVYLEFANTTNNDVSMNRELIISRDFLFESGNIVILYFTSDGRPLYEGTYLFPGDYFSTQTPGIFSDLPKYNKLDTSLIIDLPTDIYDKNGLIFSNFGVEDDSYKMKILYFQPENEKYDSIILASNTVILCVRK